MPELTHEYYLQRAARARDLANSAQDPEIRAIHERMEQSYLSLAEMSETQSPKLKLVRE